MPCPEARDWDKKYGKSLSHHMLSDDGDTLIPLDRPCDMCGEPVDRGYIHQDCMKKEMDMLNDLAVI